MQIEHLRVLCASKALTRRARTSSVTSALSLTFGPQRTRRWKSTIN